jgi:hypothetical protein
LGHETAAVERPEAVLHLLLDGRPAPHPTSTGVDEEATVGGGKQDREHDLAVVGVVPADPPVDGGAAQRGGPGVVVATFAPP